MFCYASSAVNGGAKAGITTCSLSTDFIISVPDGADNEWKVSMYPTFLVMSRLIDLFVDILPIDELGFKHVKLQSEGRPPYNPATLLKLYLYGYKHSIRSSRKLEHFL